MKGYPFHAKPLTLAAAGASSSLPPDADRRSILLLSLPICFPAPRWCFHLPLARCRCPVNRQGRRLDLGWQARRHARRRSTVPGHLASLRHTEKTHLDIPVLLVQGIEPIRAIRDAIILDLYSGRRTPMLLPAALVLLCRLRPHHSLPVSF
jgi:hypothetical protein